jgi:heat shock protein HslJ
MALLAVSGCGPSGDPATEDVAEITTIEAMPDGHSTRDAVDWAGTYTGPWPVPSETAKEASLTLASDLNYVLVIRSADGEGAEVSGEFFWSQDGGRISLKGVEEGPAFFLVGEGVLIPLNAEGERLATDSASFLHLASAQLTETQKGQTGLEGIKWRLVELMGQPVKRAEAESRAPFIQFDFNEKRVSGFGGCNNFSGGFELAEGLRIRFQPLMSTLMACPDMETEQMLLGIFERVDNYSLSADGKTLSLNKARMAPLARFEAVP